MPYLKCTVPACDRPRKSNGLCSTHDARLRATGTTSPDVPIRAITRRHIYRQGCAVVGCGGKHVGKGFCAMHLSRFKRHGDPGPAERLKAPAGSGYTGQDGYRFLFMPDHPNAHTDGRLQEHVYVMAETLGRPLRKGETVHHKNGLTGDNRPENLELWASNHPAGQRVDDLVAFARTILSLYGDEFAPNKDKGD